MDESYGNDPNAWQDGFKQSIDDEYITFADKVDIVTKELGDLLKAKNKSYGDAALTPIRIFSKATAEEGLHLRIDDKLSRLARGNEYPGDDTIKDLAGYLILLMIERKTNGKNK